MFGLCIELLIRAGAARARLEPLRSPEELEAALSDRQVRRRPQAGTHGLPVAGDAAEDLARGEAAPVGAALPHTGALQRLWPDRAGAEHGEPAPDQEEQQDVAPRLLQARDVQ